MTSDKGVVERLRERAASERAIQINNEAVAKALAGEIEAFANVFVFAGAHGYHYAGPNYADELSAARAALSPSATGSDNAG